MNSDDRMTRLQRNRWKRKPMAPRPGKSDPDEYLNPDPTDEDIAEAVRDYAKRRYEDDETGY